MNSDVDMTYEPFQDYNSQYREESMLSCSKHCEVKLVIHKKENKKYAAKIMSLSARQNELDEQVRRCVEEKQIISKMDHPNIVAYKDRFIEEQNGRFILITEYCDCKFSVSSFFSWESGCPNQRDAQCLEALS